MRFTLAHEVGHVRCGHDAGVAVDTYETLGGRSTDAREVQANAFAAELLAPAAGVRAMLDGEPTLEDVVRIAARYGISPIAAALPPRHPEALPPDRRAATRDRRRPRHGRLAATSPYRRSRTRSRRSAATTCRACRPPSPAARSPRSLPGARRSRTPRAPRTARPSGSPAARRRSGSSSLGAAEEEAVELVHRRRRGGQRGARERVDVLDDPVLRLVVRAEERLARRRRRGRGRQRDAHAAERLRQRVDEPARQAPRVELAALERARGRRPCDRDRRARSARPAGPRRRGRRGRRARAGRGGSRAAVGAAPRRRDSAACIAGSAEMAARAAGGCSGVGAMSSQAATPAASSSRSPAGTRSRYASRSGRSPAFQASMNSPRISSTVLMPRTPREAWRDPSARGSSPRRRRRATRRGAPGSPPS